jgi:hypothetical protein
MNVSIMMDDLVKEIERATMHLQLETKNKTFRAPQIIDGYLPPKNPKDPQAIEDFPFVIVRYLSDEGQMENSTAKVKVICGVYSEDDRRGWRDFLNLSNTIKTHFSSTPFFGKCFEVQLPIKREFPEEQGVPEWMGWLMLTISIPNIKAVNEDVEKIISGQY